MPGAVRSHVPVLKLSGAKCLKDITFPPVLALLACGIIRAAVSAAVSFAHSYSSEE